MALWYHKWPSLESLPSHSPEYQMDDKDSQLDQLSTQSSFLDENFTDELRAEIERTEKIFPSQNCTRPSCVSRYQRLYMLKKMSTLSDSCSLAVSRNNCKIIDDRARSSSLQDLRSPSPGNYSCAAIYCPVLDSRLMEARRWAEARKCTRWAKRRNALDDPHQMALPQSTRERIEKDIVERKSSVQRRISQFFRSAIESEPEIDLT